MTARTQPLLHYLHRLTAPSHNDASDAVLLERFVSQREETAFAALLARHGPMVHGVCRRILRDDHDAEDAFQATFLLLARKASRLRHPENLAAWLYGVARRLALTAQRSNNRRRQRERESVSAVPVSVAANPLDELSARDLLVALDEEITRLPERYRLPLILCGLEGRSHEEAARLLGWTLGSLKGRLERGRKKLQARLTRRGLAFSGAMLALGVLPGATASAAGRLTSTTLQAALAFARGERGGIAGTVLALAETGVTSMTMTKAKVGLILLLVTGLTAGARALVQQERTQEQPEARHAPNPPVTPPPAPAKKQVAVDRYGDPLPPGAMKRLGTIRLRHGGHVKSVAFAPDGKTVVSGSFDGWAFQWDVQTGRRLRAFRGGHVESLALDPEGKRLALADGLDGAMKLYELATGRELAQCPGHRAGTRVVTFSPDGKRLASCGKDKRIRVWDAATLREVRSWQAGRDEVYRLRFSPDGKSLVSAGKTLQFWDAATGAEQPLRGPLADLRIRTPSYCCSFCFSADGKTLLTGSNTAPGLLQLWDLATGKEIRTIARTKGGIGQVVLAPDGKSVWTAAGGDGLRHWDLATGKELLHLPDPINTIIEDITLSPDGKHLAAGTSDYDDRVLLWDTTTGRKILDFEGHHSFTTAAVFTPDGQHLWTGGFDGTIRYWSIDSGKPLRRFAWQEDKSENLVFSLALRPDGKMLAGAVEHRTSKLIDHDIHLWDLTTGKEREPLREHDSRAITFSPDGRLLASRGDRTICLWDAATSKVRWFVRSPETGAKGVALASDGRRVIGALDKETIGFWDVQTGRLTRQLSAGRLTGGGSIPLLSPDGRILVTGDGDQLLRVWEVASGKERCRIERPKATAYFIAALSPDGRILAWSDYERPIKLWDLLAGKQLGELGDRTNMANIESLIFSLDGRHLASTHSDSTTLIWDMARWSPKAGAAVTISAKRLEELWNELASADTAKAYRALQTLAATPAQAVSLLSQRLPKSVSADTAKLTRLLTDLDSEQFAVRERASRELEGLGMSAETAVRQALGKNPSLEVRRRLEPILDKLESGARTTEELRILRAIEVLEWIGSPEARRLLEELARDSPDDWLTWEAKASLERLARHSATNP
ncbi:MAG TPA: sigma-70 family RNA polymerase sigma factor [Gemmataceae bacterium]|jgi:RNA polymerase sigma factor (sigma-70 family)